MTRDEIESSWCLSAVEIERMLDEVIDGLAKMDADILVQLACHCREWEGKSHKPSFSSGARARLSWKLLLLDRLLRQTRINLSVLGLESGRFNPAEGYRAIVRG